jgi:hypothetical protein
MIMGIEFLQKPATLEEILGIAKRLIEKHEKSGNSSGQSG